MKFSNFGMAFFTSAMFATTPSPLLAQQEDYDRAYSTRQASLSLCGENTEVRKWAECKDGRIETATRRIEDQFKAAHAALGPLGRLLLRRDQFWFREMMDQYVVSAADHDTDEARGEVMKALTARAATLNSIAARGVPAGAALTGLWENALGSADVKPEKDGKLLVSLDLHGRYSFEEGLSTRCKGTSMLSPAGDGWYAGYIEPAGGEDKDAKIDRSRLIKLKRQADTLRIVTEKKPDEEELVEGTRFCDSTDIATGTYFAVGPAAAGDKDVSRPAPIESPTFDCSRPSSASEEEICADPELAASDRKLGQAWKTLNARLDQSTKAHLLQDQKLWVKTQRAQFAQFLHPAWDKRRSDEHQTSFGREMLHLLQRERIAMLEGFDERRQGLAGTWLAHHAILTVEIDKGGKLTATGWKWFQGDWKAGCTFEMEGSVQKGAVSFRSPAKRPNPDTLDRDGATLLVNRQDDVLAPKRTMEKNETDEQKCRRNITISSTARLFPVKASPDIGKIGDIR